MPGVARLTDIAIAPPPCPPTCPTPVIGTIVTASGNVFAEKLGVARLGDIATFPCVCAPVGTIILTSKKNNANSLGIARLGDILTVGSVTATIISSAGTVNSL